MTTLRNELNSRGIGGETFLANEILSDVKELHKQMSSMITTAQTSGTCTARGGGGTGPTLPVPTVLQDDTSILLDDQNGEKKRMFCWGGKFHTVPENFVMPRMTLQTLITYWHCGSTQPSIPPLMFARSWSFPKNAKTMKVTLSQMKRVIKAVYRAGEKVGFNFNHNKWTTARATRLYEMTAQMFAYPTVKHTRRYSSITWKTYHNQLVKNKGKLVGET